MRRLFVVALALTGCVSVSRGECDRIDWRQHGEADGAADHVREESRWYPHWARACETYPNAADQRSRYDEGVRRGFAKLCTPENARDLGAAGEPFPRSCPEDARPKLREYYRQGFLQFDLNRREDDLRRREEDLRRREEELARRTHP